MEGKLMNLSCINSTFLPSDGESWLSSLMKSVTKRNPQFVCMACQVEICESNGSRAQHAKCKSWAEICFLKFLLHCPVVTACMGITN